jgi:hypothetical protein
MISVHSLQATQASRRRLWDGCEARLFLTGGPFIAIKIVYNLRMSQEVPAVTKSFKDWISEGENLYNAALKEYQSIEQQLDDLEAKLAAKKAEVNQIAQVIGKPPVETNRRLTAQLVEEHGPNSVPNSPATIARALTGRGLGR